MKKYGFLFLTSMVWADPDLPENLSLETDAPSLEFKKKLVHLAKENQSQESHLDLVERKLNDLRKIQSLKTRDLQHRYVGLRPMIAALHRMARYGTSRILEQGQNYDDFIKTLILLRALVHTSDAHQKTLQDDLKKLHTVVDRIKVEHGKREVAQRLLKRQAVQIEELLRQRQHALKKELTRRATVSARVNQMAQESQNIHDLMRHLSNVPKEGPPKKKKKATETAVPRSVKAGFFQTPPVTGIISVPFGNITNENPDGSGIVFNARPGTRVLCPKEGQVVFAGPFRRYANIVILKHKADYVTLLAGLDRIDVDVGQTVEAGEPLGLMSAQTPAHLYLELRHHNRCIQPPLY